jgi:hypothetical protein
MACPARAVGECVGEENAVAIGSQGAVELLIRGLGVAGLLMKLIVFLVNVLC